MSGDRFDFSSAVTVSTFARLNGLRCAKTVWRWIKGGKVSAKKTPGGHWRVALGKKIPGQTVANPDKHGQPED